VRGRLSAASSVSSRCTRRPGCGVGVEFLIDPSAFRSDGGPTIARRITTGSGNTIFFRPADNARVPGRGAITKRGQSRLNWRLSAFAFLAAP
jgi:hypothetical protein